ncbi:MAG: cobalt ECF transporter T component CbiQ [Syntrophomonas sp.]|nr:cobalt ECF transporter T component CbiQ [Syntrophomonas sp.]
MSKNDRRIELPNWMGEPYENTAVTGQRRPNFLRKSIRQMKQTLADELLTESCANQEGVLQRMEPRTKLIAAVSFIIIAGFVRSIPVLLGLWGLTVVLMLLSGLPVFTMQRRIWGIIPLLTLLASVPAMFNFIIDGSPLCMIYQAPYPSTMLGIHIPAHIYISQQGFTAAMFLFLRVGLSLSMGVLLVMTTPVARLIKSLQVMGVPSLMVMVIEMSYRYLVLLLNLSIEMFEARRLRTVGVLSMASKRAQVGSSIAALFARSMELTDEVYLAMTARGYTGQAVSIDEK